MFYVKAHLPDDVTLTTEIRNDNVFTRCPCCGEEVKVDLVELLGDGKSNLEGTTVYCQACSRRKVGFDLPITLDGITWLTAVLSESGYGELLVDLFDEFGIISLRDLPESRYQDFGRALAEMATDH